jgi:hypothetical protein
MTAVNASETYILHYEGPGGEPHYYNVRAEETVPAAFNIYVEMRGERSPFMSTVVEAEDFIKFDRHHVVSGHVPGTCNCFTL